MRRLAAVFALWATTAIAGDGGVVNVYSWTDYIDDATIPAFERETGIRVVYDVMDSNDVLEGKLLAGNSGYDVVVPSGAFFGEQIRAGLYQPIDRAQLSNYDNLDPKLLRQIEKFDPGNVYGVPYLWGTTGIAYNVDEIEKRMPDAPVDHWRMLFDPAIVSRFADCGVTLLDAGDEVFETALIYLGRDPNSEAREDLEAAAEVVRKVQPYIRYFHSSSYIDDLANGEICLALGWSGDVLQAEQSARKGVDIAYTIPAEGAIVWFDIMAIPKDAPHPRAAHDWIDFILRPGIIANISEAVYYANPNKASRPLLSPEIRNDPAIYPSDAVMDRLTAIAPKSPRYNRMRNREWTQAKAGR